MRVPKPPSFVNVDGSGLLVHELHLTNLAPTLMTLRRVEVLTLSSDGRQTTTIGSLEDSVLAQALIRPGVAPPPPPAERARIGGGLRAVVFLWIPAATAPGRLRHRITVAWGSGDSVRTQTLEDAAVPVLTDVVVIGPPLRGGTWLTANGPNAATGHRRALITAEATPTIAQRFAIDYLQVDDSGRSFVGDRLRNENYYAQGEEAIAVADGVVAATKDGIPENNPGVNSRAVPITLETVGGNFVILDIGKGHYAFYAHLQPGSLRVRVGDRVRRGQVVGLVGNSGNSTEPHLHFHVMDGTSPLGSEGVPYVHDSFGIEGRCRQIFTGCTRTATPEMRRRELPLANIILRFP
jgi:hypothetical protein